MISYSVGTDGPEYNSVDLSAFNNAQESNDII